MKNTKVPIKYQYYQVCAMKEDKEYVYDLRNWIDKINKLEYKERLKNISGINGRLEDIILIYDDRYYALNFMRLNVNSNAYLVKENIEARHINLEDDEYMGKNTVVLYDWQTNILMIQCNKGSYGTAALSSYMNSFNTQEELFHLRPVLYKFDREIKGNEVVKKLDIRFANIRDIRTKPGEFEKIIETCNKVECLTAHIEFGIGYARQKELNKETISNIIDNIKNNKQGISSARITLGDDQKSSIYDLLENVDNDIIEFIVPDRGELEFELMAKTMAERYTNGGTRNRMLKLIGKVNDNEGMVENTTR